MGTLGFGLANQFFVTGVKRLKTPQQYPSLSFVQI
jgi:hypothetical protein